MKVSLYSISYLGAWYSGPALNFEDFVKRAKDAGYPGVELDGKRPHGNPMDFDQKTREKMRSILEREGMELPCIAANNDFSSPIPEHREAQLLYLKELVRLASDLGSKIVRVFAAWHGIAMHGENATYDLTRGNYYTFERQYPYATRLDRWNFVKDCLKEAAEFSEEFGVTLALQNHPPLIRHWKDTFDLMNEVDSPNLKMCLDLPLMSQSFEIADLEKACKMVKGLQVYTHFGGEFFRDSSGRVQLKELEYGQDLPDYARFVKYMKEIGYTGYIGYELCHPVVDDKHNIMGIDYVDQQVKLAQEFMSTIIKENYK